MRNWDREPRWTRRAMVQATGAASLAIGLGIGHRCCHGTARAAQAVDAVTTLTKTAVLGAPRVAGLSYRPLEPGSGWPVLVRNDLLVTAPTRAANPTPLVSFAHLTDIHIIDAASPGHPAFVRQYPGSLGGISFTYAFRPQETLTTHVVDTMIRRLNAIGEGPISGRPFDFAISTGDNADSRGAHEMESLLTAFNGGEVSFNAASVAYAGMQDNSTDQPAATYDAYWHPEAPPSAFGEDSWKREHGFPTLPDFLEAISTPIEAAGLEMPWYGGFGNHDAILLGLLPDASGPAKLLETVAPTDQMLVALPSGMTIEQFLGELATATDAQVEEMLARMIKRTVPAAASRASFTRRDFVQMHLAHEGRYGPNGHGFSQENVDRDTAYYQFSMAPGIVGFMLDTTNSNGGSDGSLEPEQAAWLEAELVKVHGRYLSPTGQWVETGNENHLVVLFSHHNSFTLENLTTAPGETTSDRLNWAAFKALIQRFPNVILWVNGHNHTNRVLAHVDPSGNTGGLWEINTAAHVDYPQQSRIIEMLDNQNGVLSITGVMVDAGDAELIPSGPPYDTASLAALAQELAANDPATNVPYRLGNVTDLNVELLIQKPF